MFTNVDVLDSLIFVLADILEYVIYFENVRALISIESYAQKNNAFIRTNSL